MEADRRYFERRAEEESVAADSASEAARIVHLELAARYAQLAAAIAMTDRQLGLVGRGSATDVPGF